MILPILDSAVLNWTHIGTHERRLYSTILAEFPWYSKVLVEAPATPLDLLDNLPGFKVSM